MTTCPEVVCGGEYAESIGPWPSCKVIFIFMWVDGHCGGQTKCVFSLFFYVAVTACFYVAVTA